MTRIHTLLQHHSNYQTLGTLWIFKDGVHPGVNINVAIRHYSFEEWMQLCKFTVVARLFFKAIEPFSKVFQERHLNLIAFLLIIDSFFNLTI